MVVVWTESSQFLCRAEGGCEFRELPLVMPPSKVCPQCNAVVPIRLKVCRNRLKFALYNADRVNFKSRNYHVVAYNISILAEGLHFSALVLTGNIVIFPFSIYINISASVISSYSAQTHMILNEQEFQQVQLQIIHNQPCLIAFVHPCTGV